MPAGLAAHPAEWLLAGGVRVRSTGRAQGDMSGPSERLERRRRSVVDLPWTVLRQVHGPRVVSVGPGQGAGEAADAAVASVEGVALAVLTADCAPVALGSDEGVFAVAHAGWRGLRSGVVEATVQAMRRLGATRVEAVIGPCIRPCCYSFGEADLSAVARRLGPSVRAVDSSGGPSLDLPAGVRAALQSAGAEVAGDCGVCTSCSGAHWSWRADRTDRRQATVAWRA